MTEDGREERYAFVNSFKVCYKIEPLTPDICNYPILGMARLQYGGKFQVSGRQREVRGGSVGLQHSLKVQRSVCPDGSEATVRVAAAGFEGPLGTPSLERRASFRVQMQWHYAVLFWLCCKSVRVSNKLSSVCMLRSFCVDVAVAHEDSVAAAAVGCKVGAKSFVRRQAPLTSSQPQPALLGYIDWR